MAVPFKIPGQRELDLAAGTVWRARVEASGHWGETKLVLPEKSADGVVLRVFPAGSLQGRVLAPEARQTPASLSVRVRFTPAPGQPGRKDALDEILECPIRQGLLDCAVPAGLLDLRLRTAEGFAPIYLWGQRVEPGKTLKLGDLRLIRGASVSGWVETAEGKPLPDGCKVGLAPQTASDLNISVSERLGGTAVETRANERGFFQFSGVPPGNYVLTAQQAGFSLAVLAPVQVRPDLESQIIDRLVLTRPVSLEVEVHPALEPYGLPWRITLARKDAPSERPREVFKGAASEAGLWKSPPIPQGTYELSVAGDLDTVWYSEFLEIREGEPPVRIDVPVLEVRGTIRQGKKPLQTSFWLGRKEGQRVRFDSDEDGRFEGVLPGPGQWIPALASGSRPAVAFEPIEIRKPQGKRFAEVEIAVPDTRLKGEVVDESGRPVPGGRITVTSLEKDRRMIQLQSDEKGAFLLEGASPGEIELQAEHEGTESDFVASRLEDGVESPPVSLVVRRLKGFPGRIVSSGPVGGALVRAFPVSSGSASFRMDDDVSGPDGRFELNLQAGAGLLNVLVYPPGYAFKMTAVAAVPGQPMEINVDPQGGTLILELPESGPSPLLAHGGTFTSPQLLQPWARMQGARASDPRRLVIPNVEAGPYSLCLGAAAVSHLREGRDPPAAACTSGVLAPNGELVLRAGGS